MAQNRCAIRCAIPHISACWPALAVLPVPASRKGPDERSQAANAQSHRRMAGGEHLAVLRADRRVLRPARAGGEGHRRRRRGARHQGHGPHLQRPADARGDQGRRGGSQPSPAARRIQGRHPRGEDQAGPALHAGVAPPGPAQRRGLAAAQPSRAEGQPDHAPGRHHQADHRRHPRPHALELQQPHAAGPGDAWACARRPTSTPR